MQITVGGTNPNGNALGADNPVIIGGGDGTNVRILSTDTSGRLEVIGGAADGATSQGNPVLIGGSDGSNTVSIGMNPQHQVKVLTEGQKRTYTAIISGFTPTATPTDFINIPGSASSTTVKLLSVKVTGVATANAMAELFLVKRSTANSSGTPTAATSVLHDTADTTAATIVINSYAANPTTGALVGKIGAKKFILSKDDGTGLGIRPAEWVWTAHNDKAPTLHGVAQNISLNWGGAAIPAGIVLDVEIVFTEE